MDTHSLERLDFYRVRDILAGFAATALGRGLAQTVHPVTRFPLVQRWLAQVQELERLAEERGLPPLGGISDVREVVQRCAPPLRVTVEEMAAVGATLAGTHTLTEYLANLPEDRPELRHLAERLGDFQSIAQRIAAVIDERGRVRDDASPKLQRIRGEIADAGRQIEETVARLLRDPAVRRCLQYPNHTFHGDRLVVPLRTEYRGRLPGIVHRTSDSGATLYVEPAEVVELNNRISNLRSEEQEEIGRLLWELAHEVHLNGREIHRTLETIAVLDLVVAKLRFAKAFEARCPQLNEEGTLSVRGARHPLLVELTRKKEAAAQPHEPIVPIDYRLGVDFNLLIITGPNTGGKTVTLKTVGLLALMLQAGLPVPVAAGSEFGIFSNVLIDVGDEQSMQQSLSTFSAHLTRLLEMLRHAGPRALLLIDELGAGTDPDEGAALGRAIMDELLRLHCRAMVTTHLGALKAFALLRPGAENACVEFDAATLRPTYHLRLGEAGASNAIEIAGRLGMPRRLVNAAQRNLSRKAKVLRTALDDTRTVKRRAEDARRAADDARLASEKAAGEADAARARLERQQADFQQWVQRVVHLQAGDAVRVRNFDRDGRIVRLRLDQHRAEVDVGAFSVEVPLGDVLPPEAPPPPPRPPRPVAPAMPPKRPRVRPPRPAEAAGVAAQPGADQPGEGAGASGIEPRSAARPGQHPAGGQHFAARGGSGQRPGRGEPGQFGPRRRDERGPAQHDQRGPAAQDERGPARRDERGPWRRDDAQRGPARRGEFQRGPSRSGEAQRGPLQRGEAARGPMRRDERPEPARLVLPPLTPEEAAALKPHDHVYVQRFNRQGRIVRVLPAKKLVLVDVGLLEVEVPFDGLSLMPRHPEPPRPPPRKPSPPPPAAEPVPAPAADAAPAPVSDQAPTTQSPSGSEEPALERSPSGSEEPAPGQTPGGNETQAAPPIGDTPAAPQNP